MTADGNEKAMLTQNGRVLYILFIGKLASYTAFVFTLLTDFMKTRQIGICRAVKQLELPRVNAAI